MDYLEWLTQELSRSPRWQAHVDARRLEALRPRRTASQFSIASYASLDQLQDTYQEWTYLPRHERPFAWSPTRVEDRFARHSGADLAPNRPLDHLRRWNAGLSRDEVSWIGATAAPQLHKLYCSPTGYVPSLPELGAYPAPIGRQASLAAGKLSGADFDSPNARSQAFRRSTPRYGEDFVLMVRPERHSSGS